LSAAEQEEGAQALRWRDALVGALHRRSLSRTIPAATIVGSILFMVNLYSSVRDGPFTWVLAAQITLTFLVPWLNATMGIAIGLRHGSPSPGPPAAGRGGEPRCVKQHCTSGKTG
jgi:hypothetical protein